jgi:hypothetical protein
MSRQITPRQTQRRSVALAATWRTQSGLRANCQISDISANGCCVETKGLYVKVGVRVVIRPQGLEGLTGIVRWVEGPHAGVEFDSPLYQPVVDHLVNLHATRRGVGLEHC